MLINPDYTAHDAAADWAKLEAAIKAAEKAMDRLYSRDDQAFARKEGFGTDMDCDLYSLMLGCRRMKEEYLRRADAAVPALQAAE